MKVTIRMRGGHRVTEKTNVPPIICDQYVRLFLNANEPTFVCACLDIPKHLIKKIIIKL